MSRSRTRIPKMIKRFEDAVRAHAFIGAAHPEEHFEIEQEYKEAKKRLQSYIGMLMDKCKPTFLIQKDKQDV